MATTERTRFRDEAERIKDTYESMDSLANSPDMDELAELIRTIAGFDSTGRYDPDVQTVGRQAAYAWLRDRGYINDPVR